MALLLGVLGCFVLAIIAQEVFEVILLPRRVRRRLRLVRLFFRSTWTCWSWAAKRISSRSSREALLSFYGPLAMMVLIGVWATGFIAGFGLLQWAIQAGTPTFRPLRQMLYLSGATFFTLGYGDVTPIGPWPKALAIVEAGTGFGFIAIVIGYLPVLYQVFTRREAHVIQLDARAGSPPTATTLLSQHSEGQGLEDLYQLLRSWEQWAAEMVETHLSYPMLSYYRSQHDNQSWLGAMCLMLDACALILVGLRDVRTFPAKMNFAIARLALVELCRVFGVQPRSNSTERLSSQEFRVMRDALNQAGLLFSDEPGAEERLAALRATYEPFSDEFVRLLNDAASWMATRPGFGQLAEQSSRTISETTSRMGARQAGLACADRGGLRRVLPLIVLAAVSSGVRRKSEVTMAVEVLKRYIRSGYEDPRRAGAPDSRRLRRRPASPFRRYRPCRVSRARSGNDPRILHRCSRAPACFRYC